MQTKYTHAPEMGHRCSPPRLPLWNTPDTDHGFSEEGSGSSVTESVWHNTGQVR